MDILKKVTDHSLLFNTPPKHMPTTGVPDGPLQGNGDLGGSWCTAGDTLVCYLGKNDMWLSKPSQRGGGIKNLAVVKFAVDGLDEQVFDAVCRLTDAETDIDLSSVGGKLHVSSVMPRGKSMLIVRLTCTDGNVKVSADLNTLDDSAAVCTRNQDGNKVSVTKNYEGAELDWPTRACATLVVLNSDNLSVNLTSGQTATVVVSAYTNHDTDNPAAAVQNELDGISDASAAKYLEGNRTWWKNFWEKSYVSLPDEPDVEKCWYASNYLLACCCAPGKFPPGIFGNFITTDRADWGGDYHLNYNYEAPWWGAYSSNHIELAEPYDTPLMEYIPQAQKNARELLGCGGIYSVVGIGPMGNECAYMYNDDGTPNHEAPFWGQKSNAAYAAVDMVMRFYSEYDADYARDKAYPYISEVLAFWEDYLTWEDGRYVIHKDCIHENGALGRTMHGEKLEGPDDNSNDTNPLVSLGLIHVLIKCALDMCAFLGIDEPRAEKWKFIDAHLSKYPLQTRNGKTVFRYTEVGMDWCNGNSLGIQHIYPCGAIGLSSDPELLTVARNTLVEMSRWDDYNALPTFYSAAARLGYDPDEILRHLNEVMKIRGFANGFIYCGGGGVECLSVVPGCVNEMLMQSHEGVIRLFPVWNSARNAEFMNLRAYGAFLVSASMNNGSITSAEIYSEKGNHCVLLSPWDNVRITCDGNTVPTSEVSEHYGKTIHFDTKPGFTYKVEHAE